MRAARVVFYAGVVIVVLVAAATAWAVRYPAIATATPPERTAFSADAIAKGQMLVLFGDCASCHTAQNGAPLAGGYGVPTPFGTIYATNITPDVETGIGGWTEAAFTRALREGISRDGHHLYPAFPYNHFTKTTDDDIAALYAFLMTRPPVKATPPANKLPFPLNVRAVVAGWNLLYLHAGPFEPVVGQTAQWNRGAYLAEGVGHCSTCHTSKDFLGGEKGGAAQYGGDDVEGWEAYALNDRSPARAPWTADQLVAYLTEGHADVHGWAAGPMQGVAFGTAALPAQDISAIATYVASFQRQGSAKPVMDQAIAFADAREYGPARAPTNPGPATATTVAADAGESIFAGLCATCHRAGDGLPVVRPVRMALSSSVASDDPTNFIQVVLNGIQPLVGVSGAYMPGFGDTLSDDQIEALAGYVRAHFTDKATWADLAKPITEARSHSSFRTPQPQTAFNGR
jgi:mono/diheme cytochrome c family protein